jgi:hypothetical protein
MTETIHINWLLLLGPFLWALGAAILLALLGRMQFLTASNQMKYQDFFKRPAFKNSILISIVLIISGLLFNYAKLPSDKLIAVKIDKQNIPVKSFSPETPLLFSPKNLKMDPHNKSHIFNNEKMQDHTLVMFWDGYIQTPFIRFAKGDYRIEFQAKGSPASSEFSKLKVEFEIPDNNNYLRVTANTYIELTGKMETFHMDFQTEANTIGRIRITFFNDIYIPKTEEGRDVWIRELVIKANEHHNI